MRLYPNPNNGLFDLVILDNELREAAVEIVDVNGALVFSAEAEASSGSILSIDLSHLATGIYFVRVASESISKTEKLIIQRP
jgi:hypothetical protein